MRNNRAIINTANETVTPLNRPDERDEAGRTTTAEDDGVDGTEADGTVEEEDDKAVPTDCASCDAVGSVDSG